MGQANQPTTEDFRSYLQLLDNLRGVLAQLNQVARGKLAAVRADDLAALDECIRQEQAHSLSLRSIEQKRAALLTKLGLVGTPLSRLAEHYPAELRAQAADTATALRRIYDEYSSASKAALTALQSAMRQIDQMLAARQEREEAGVDENASAAQRAGGGIEPPANMKTDFRA